MIDKVIRVGHAIALDVGTIRIVGIWPPVVTFGIKVVLAAALRGQ